MYDFSCVSFSRVFKDDWHEFPQCKEWTWISKFLDISDAQAVLENAFHNFSCLSKGDIFTFEYNDQTYDIAVLEIKTDTDQHAIVTMETDLEVNFATPTGYEEPKRASGTSTLRSGAGVPSGFPRHVNSLRWRYRQLQEPSILPGPKST
jgi:hypothetical protein